MNTPTDDMDRFKMADKYNYMHFNANIATSLLNTPVEQGHTPNTVIWFPMQTDAAKVTLTVTLLS